MKVLMIDQWLPLQPYAQELCRPLSQEVDLTLATTRYYVSKREPFRVKCVLESKAKKSISGLARYFGGVLWMYGAALFGSYDVIHIQAFKKWEFEMLPFRMAKSIRKRKIVYTAHNILPHEHDDKQTKEADALKNWYRACDAIIVHNEQSRNVLIDFLPEVAEKIQVVPHGTFDTFSAFADQTVHDKTVFLQFGMFRKYKGIDFLLKAVSGFPKEIREKICIVIVGNQRKDQDDTDYKAILEAEGVSDFVYMDNHRVPDDKVAEYFNQADCCLFPYSNIYGSGALLMAYSFEKPVIASNIPTFTEETDYGKTGLLYEPGNAEDLRKAVIHFMKMPEEEKYQMKMNIQELCRTKYSWKVSAKRLKEIYEAVLDGRLFHQK